MKTFDYTRVDVGGVVHGTGVLQCADILAGEVSPGIFQFLRDCLNGSPHRFSADLEFLSRPNVVVVWESPTLEGGFTKVYLGKELSRFCILLAGTSTIVDETMLEAAIGLLGEMGCIIDEPAVRRKVGEASRRPLMVSIPIQQFGAADEADLGLAEACLAAAFFQLRITSSAT